MAAVILCSGKKGKRKALKRSRTMIHQPIGFTGYSQASDMEIEDIETKKLKQKIKKEKIKMELKNNISILLVIVLGLQILMIFLNGLLKENIEWLM
jgi:ATP-dependent protease ClpP protease subunit